VSLFGLNNGISFTQIWSVSWIENVPRHIFTGFLEMVLKGKGLSGNPVGFLREV